MACFSIIIIVFFQFFGIFHCLLHLSSLVSLIRSLVYVRLSWAWSSSSSIYYKLNIQQQQQQWRRQTYTMCDCPVFAVQWSPKSITQYMSYTNISINFSLSLSYCWTSSSWLCVQGFRRRYQVQWVSACADALYFPTQPSLAVHYRPFHAVCCRP